MISSNWVRASSTVFLRFCTKAFTKAVGMSAVTRTMSFAAPTLDSTVIFRDPSSLQQRVHFRSGDVKERPVSTGGLALTGVSTSVSSAWRVRSAPRRQGSRPGSPMAPSSSRVYTAHPDGHFSSHRTNSERLVETPPDVGRVERTVGQKQLPGIHITFKNKGPENSARIPSDELLTVYLYVGRMRTSSCPCKLPSLCEYNVQRVQAYGTHISSFQPRPECTRATGGTSSVKQHRGLRRYYESRPLRVGCANRLV
ncbi:hypothetical protein Q5P01_021940 [Channa striata]|uniref:Uncharacterized protein n=1 Tax=Channa striata TaxID=64152 RepID=A0AA88IRM6_CHASR|nr:hypothetical protein Q5P01_021940 [Channa striata]